ncbi:hypothetical protein [Kangiella sp. TOML190]|uniref:hypothetical protein n=1 Tax=Kangiella sp. TOML190 TaxID=2931351 RepID=UPI0020402AD5|nr:hypothetical protein [Kangiella sp. TOML190]
MAQTNQDLTNLKNLIVRLGEDPELLQAYVKSPEAVLLGADVPKEQVEVVLSGDQKAIKSLLDDNHLAITIIHLPKC